MSHPALLAAKWPTVASRPEKQRRLCKLGFVLKFNKVCTKKVLFLTGGF